jgi:hypothetical protein
MLVVRAPARLRLRPLAGVESWTAQGQRVLTVPAEHAVHPGADSTANRPESATARLLLVHAHRARHLLADRAVLANVPSARRAELTQEIQRLRGVMRSLEQQIEVTTRSLEAMERLAGHLHRVTELLQEAGVMEPSSRDAAAS